MYATIKFTTWRSISKRRSTSGIYGIKPTPEQEETFSEDVLRIQRSSQQYGLLKDAVIEEANECQVPVGEHHVSCWFEMLFGDNREAAESYLDELIEAIKEPEG